MRLYSTYNSTKHSYTGVLILDEEEQQSENKEAMVYKPDTLEFSRIVKISDNTFNTITKDFEHQGWFKNVEEATQYFKLYCLI